MKKLAVFLLCLLFFSPRLFANHLLGGEINYKFVSAQGNKQTYRVTLSLFGDCAAASMPQGAYYALPGADPLIKLYNGNTFVSSVHLSYDAAQSNIEITPVCPDEAGNTTCTNVNNPLPGIKKFVYSGNIELTGTSDSWRFAFDGSISAQTTAGRSLSIQNAQITDPITNVTIMYLEATLNNTVGTNSSTTFTSLPTPFFCLNKAATYNLGAADAENDQLVFSLIPGKSVINDAPLVLSDVTYVNPFSSDHPLPTAPGGFNFNTTNGQMDFTPNLVRNCMVVSLVEEYRNGVKVGSSMREMIFVILNNCNNDAPLSPVSAIENANVNVDASGNLMLSVCEGQTANIAFDINCSDPNGDNTTVTYNNLPAGAAITVDDNGSLHPHIHFVWNVINAVPGNYIFYITYTDDGCPLVSTKTVAYTITIVPHTYQFTGDALPACAHLADGMAWAYPSTPLTIDYEYRWEDEAGNTIRQQHSTNGDTLRDIAPGHYKVYIRNSDGCGKNLDITVDSLPEPLIRLPADTFLCAGMPFPLSNEPQPGVDYLWSNGAEGCCITVTEPGTYVLTASNRCSSTKDSVTIHYVKCNFCLFVPNAFTPNGDGKNDEFNILETCVLEKYKLQVFNRWGQLVFTSLSSTKSWDGTYKGSPAEGGTYFYIIEAEPVDKSKGTVMMKGDLTLIR